jgi:phage-related protein
MTVRSSIYFTFNSRRSDEFNIINVNMSTGMQSEPFSLNRSIREQKVKGNDQPYFMGLELQPLEITVSFAFENQFTTDKLREVARWLTTKYYAPLQFFDESGGGEDRIFYCLLIDGSELTHNSSNSGYINLKFRCIDAYTYTKVYEDIINLPTNPTAGTIHIFDNFGDDNCKPYLEIVKIGNGNVSIFNQSNGNAEMTLTGLLDNETVTVDCENRIITSDIPLTNRYGNLQGDYLTIPIFNNYLLIKGNCNIRFKYQLKRYQ